MAAKKFPTDELLRKILEQLTKNPKLYVDEFGINYDGECYCYVDNSLLLKSEYSLLALSIEPAELLKFVD